MNECQDKLLFSSFFQSLSDQLFSFICPNMPKLSKQILWNKFVAKFGQFFIIKKERIELFSLEN